MSQDAVEQEITLKNGAKVKAGEAVAIHDFLESLFRRNPQHFAAIKSLVGDNKSTIAEGVLQDIQRSKLLMENGQLRAAVRHVFESSYRFTSEGELFTSPFQPATEIERETIELVEARKWNRIAKLGRKIIDDPNVFER